jgi:hypothetical protein
MLGSLNKLPGELAHCLNGRQNSYPFPIRSHWIGIIDRGTLWSRCAAPHRWPSETFLNDRKAHKRNAFILAPGSQAIVVKSEEK